LLEPHSAGQEILRFLQSRKFRILELLKSDPLFREHAVTVLRAAADAFEATRQGKNFSLTDDARAAIEATAKLLLPESARSRGEHDEVKSKTRDAKAPNAGQRREEQAMD
jgi:hypothetical protein